MLEDTHVGQINNDDDDGVDTVDTGAAPERERPWACYARVEIDFDTDSTIDAYAYNVYDPERQDLLLHYEYDPRDDGRVTTVADYTYDDNDNRTSYLWDSGADGTLDYRELWSFDDDSHETRYELDEDGKQGARNSSKCRPGMATTSPHGPRITMATASSTSCAPSPWSTA